MRTLFSRWGLYAGTAIAVHAETARAAQRELSVLWLVQIVVVLFLAIGIGILWQRYRRAADALRQITRRIEHDLQCDIQGKDSRPEHDGLAAMEKALAALRSERERLAEQCVLRAEAEEKLRSSEERYALAVRGANDGMWEWDLDRNTAHYSARWKNLLGYSEQDISARVEEWLDRVHPEDRPRLSSEISAHLQGRTPRIGIEHRLRHRDGSWRWVLSRATAVRNAEGRAVRLIGLMTDISARKRVQEALIELADGLAGVQGEACFRALVRSFAGVLNAREAFLCECVEAPVPRVRMLAYWKAQDYAPCVEFDLAGTACEGVVREGKVVYCPSGVGDRWPLEREYDRDAYLGIPCYDSMGAVIGHLACADPGPLPEELPHQAILRIFAVRASIELERRRMLAQHALFMPSQHARPQTLH
ncbi:MAG TPA: PAS domain-containing protein [Burkholderiales bacterium]|nr:PAS domain-containing protein [Burkholderiales bacterium]